MGPARSNEAKSLPERVQRSQIGSEATFDAPVTALLWCGERVGITLGDGDVCFTDASLSTQSRRNVHKGAILAAALMPDGRGVITGGDDGVVRCVMPNEPPLTIANVQRGWADQVASAPWGAIAWAGGRDVECLLPNGQTAGFKLPSSCGGLAFAPKGQRLAAAHYGGVTVFSPALKGASSLKLVWGGSHIAVRWSPDARFIVTPMQENALHGWRVNDKASLHMSGYPLKPRSLSWSRNGRLLATSGSNGALLWPFKGKDGPMGKSAQELAPEGTATTAIAFHPKYNLLAIGYLSGLVAVVRLASDAVVTLRGRDEKPIDHLAWSTSGNHLAYASSQGSCGILDMEKIVREPLE